MTTFLNRLVFSTMRSLDGARDDSTLFGRYWGGNSSCYIYTNRLLNDTTSNEFHKTDEPGILATIVAVYE